MKKFEFTLRRMQNYQEQLLDREKNTLARLRLERDRIEDEIEHWQSEYRRNSEELIREQAEGITPQKLRSYDNFFVSTRARVKELRAELAKAQAAVDKQMEVVILASQEVSKLEKLEEKQREDYDKMVQKAEEAFIEELVSGDSIRKQIT